MGIEPIHNGNDTKIMKIMPLSSQCERAFSDLNKQQQRHLVTK